MNKVLLTGISGLIGASVRKQLLDMGKSVVGIYRQQPDYSLNKNEEAYLFNFNEEWNSNQLPNNIDAIIHLAQNDKFREFPDKAEETFRTNTFSTLKLLDYAHQVGAKTFVYASSAGLYGYGDTGFTEKDLVSASGDLGFYFGSKLCSEIIAENYYPLLNIIILRFFFVYGPGQRKNMLIPRLVSSVLNRKPIILHGYEGIKISPTYVEDAANALIKSLNLKGIHKFNIAGPEILTMRDIGNIIGTELDIDVDFQILDIEQKHLFGDITKMKNILGEPIVGFREGIKAYATSI